jgi:hypothetical protein
MAQGSRKVEAVTPRDTAPGIMDEIDLAEYEVCRFEVHGRQWIVNHDS